jgi:hypothetical protein
MDKKLEEALDFSNFRFTLNTRKQNLRLRMKSMLTVGYNNTIFSASIELINFSKLIIDTGNDQYVFMDDNDNPIMIKDVKDFHARLLSAYTGAVNEFYLENEQLKKLRSTKQLAGIQ